ncbi:hypothetical protein EV424DRAFT_1345377 [Suillus variegatus]|nr:hypothetical protein EV424DRAFT_1345377 [Suillus variegatus]
MSSSLDSGSDRSDFPMKSNPNLEELWQEMREQGWKKRNRLFRHKVLGFLCIQGAAFFMLMTNPRVQDVSTVHYNMLVALSFTCSLEGLFYHCFFWKSDADIEMHERINQRLSRRKVIHISLVRMANLAAMGSWGHLAGGLISIVLGGNAFTSHAAAGAVALLLHQMTAVDDELVSLILNSLASILYLGMAMR